jgi:trimeric autotransporter adhesin
MKSRKMIFTTVLSALACFALCQQAQSATDTPDPGGSLPVSNTADGQLALASITTGIYNSAFGFFSLLSNSTGNFNTAVGGAALLVNNGDPAAGEGTENTAVGAGALLSNTIGGDNTANGAFALFTNTDGDSHSAFGDRALLNQDGGLGNSAFGASALEANSSSGNAAFGYHALDSCTGGLNTAFGADTMVNATNGSGNVALGFAAGNGVTSGSNIIAIGPVDGLSTTNGELDNSCYIGNIDGAGVDAGTASIVFVDQDGKLGTVALPNTGSLPNAQAFSGKVHELEATVALLTQQLKEQAAQIQKVSAQLEISKPAPQVVANKP